MALAGATFALLTSRQQRNLAGAFETCVEFIEARHPAGFVGKRSFYGLSRDNNRIDVDSVGPSPYFIDSERTVELAQITQHPYYPFRNFRSDDLSFLLLEMYWAELFRRAVDGSRQAGAWAVQTPADREDGNPILHVTNRQVRPARVLRVVQRFNTEGLPELDLATLAPVRCRCGVKPPRLRTCPRARPTSP